MTLACALEANERDQTPEDGEAGSLNQQVTLDLELGINTGAQGIVVRATCAPWNP